MRGFDGCYLPQVTAPSSSLRVVDLDVGVRIAGRTPVKALFAVHRLRPAPGHFLPLPFWERALAAAVFEAALVRPSLRTLLAAVGAFVAGFFVFFYNNFLQSQARTQNFFREHAVYHLVPTVLSLRLLVYLARYPRPQLCTSFQLRCAAGALACPLRITDDVTLIPRLDQSNYNRVTFALNNPQAPRGKILDFSRNSAMLSTGCGQISHNLNSGVSCSIGVSFSCLTPRRHP